MSPLQVRIPDDLRDRIDALRGPAQREPYICRALEYWCGTAERALAEVAMSSRAEALASHNDPKGSTP